MPNAELSLVEDAMAQESLQHGWRKGDAPDGPPIPSLGARVCRGERQVRKVSRELVQEKEIEKMRANSHVRIPDAFDYSSLPCLSTEEVEKFTSERPETLEHASNIPGVTPKALLYLYQGVQLHVRKQAKAAAEEAVEERACCRRCGSDGSAVKQRLDFGPE